MRDDKPVTTQSHGDRPQHPIRAWIRRNFYEDTLKQGESGRHAPQMPKFVPALMVTLILALVLGWLLFAGFARLSGDGVSWWWPNKSSIKGNLFDVTRSTVTAAGVFAGVFAIVYAYRKQRVEEAAGLRADAAALADAKKDFSRRYQDAAEQLGHDKAAVRLAGAYSMARLADDWTDQRQTCVDVLCAYLRMPWPGEEQEESERQVRGSIAQILVNHLCPEAQPSWSSMSFDFQGARLRDFKLIDVIFDNDVTFDDVIFAARCTLYMVHFEGQGSFDRCIVEGDLRLEGLSGCESGWLAHAVFWNSLVVQPGGRLDLVAHDDDDRCDLFSITLLLTAPCG